MTPMMFPYVTCSARHKWDEELKWQSTRSSGGGGGQFAAVGMGWEVLVNHPSLSLIPA